MNKNNNDFENKDFNKPIWNDKEKIFLNYLKKQKSKKNNLKILLLNFILSLLFLILLIYFIIMQKQNKIWW